MTESPSLLLPTIVSRCRELKLHPWDDRTVLSVLEKHGVTGQRAQEALHVSGGSIGKALAVAGDEQYWQRRSEVMRDFFALERRSDILRISSTWKDRKETRKSCSTMWRTCCGRCCCAIWGSGAKAP